MTRLVVLGWLILLATTTIVRGRAWASNQTLWTSAVRVAPCSIRAHANLALATPDPDQQLAEWRIGALLSIGEIPACARPH